MSDEDRKTSRTRTAAAPRGRVEIVAPSGTVLWQHGPAGPAGGAGRTPPRPQAPRGRRAPAGLVVAGAEGTRQRAVLDDALAAQHRQRRPASEIATLPG